MFLLQPLLNIVHFLKTTFYYIWGASIHIGRAILCILFHIFVFLRDLFEAFVIVGDELFKFIIELNSSIVALTNYIGSSTNCGIAAVNDGIATFFQSTAAALRTSKLHTRLLATKLCLTTKNFFNLICGALSLISDTIWWLILLIPRLIVYAIVSVADFCIFGFNFLIKAAVYAVSVVVEDVFKISIGLLVLYVLWRKRHVIHGNLLSCLRRIKRIFRSRTQLIVNRWHGSNQPRFGNPTRLPIPASTSTRLSRSPLRETKLPDQQRCVVCRDNPKKVLLWPCRHMCLCDECADRMTGMGTTSCPLCRSEVEFCVTVYT